MPAGGGPTGARRRAGRTVLVLVVALVTIGAVVDLRRPPARQLTARGAIAAIHWYRDHLASWAAAGGARCRFRPTCSHYAERAIAAHGAWRGGWLTARRLVRCGPWTPVGTVDEVPLASAANQP